MEKDQNAVLGAAPLGKLMVKFSLPCTISLLVGALYNIVDQIFIGRGVGYLGNGATNVVFPLTVLALGLAVMIGDGACSYVSICFGRGRPAEANRAVGSTVTLSVCTGVLVAALYAVFQTPLLRLFGATEANFAYAKEYFTCITIGIPIYVFGQAVNPILRADGSPRFAMASMLAGAIANCILDPIAIFVLHWGVMGAEFALGVLALLLTQLLPLQLIRLFGSESALYDAFAVLTFRVYLCMLPLATVNKAAFIFMQALGKPVESAGLSFFREVLLAVPLVVLLPKAFGLMGVLYSMPAADIITFAASCVVLARTDRTLRQK